MVVEELETYFYLDGSLSSGSPYTIFPDYANLALGTSADCTLYHNSTHTYISNVTGSLIIQNLANDQDIVFECDDGSGGNATYFYLDGSVVKTIFSKDVRLLNDVELAVGTNKALSFVYNGANSSISNYYGDLYIDQNNDDGDIRFRSDNGSGGLAEYFRIDGGANQTIFSVSALLQDGVYLHIGTGADLQLYHDATNSNITNNTGDLRIHNTADDKDILLICDDGSGGNATYIQLDGSVTRNKLLQHTSLPDGKILILGAGDDLQLYHDGSDSLIRNYTGSLYIKNEQDDGDVLFQSDDGSGGIGTYFYLDGSLADGTNVYTRFPDQSKILLGTGGDMGLWHDGSNSYLSSATGDLVFYNSADNKDIIFQSDDGSGGVKTYFYLDGSAERTIFPDSMPLQLGGSAGTGDLQLMHNGTNSYISNYEGDLYINQGADDKDIIFQCDDQSGGVTDYLRLDGSAGQTIVSKNVKFLDSTYAVFGTGSDLHIYHNGTDSHIDNNVGNLNIVNNTDNGDINFYCDDGSGSVEVYFYLDGSVSSGNPYTIFPTNARCAWGNSSELQIFHTGTDTYIANYTGPLYITNDANDSDIIFQCDDGSGGTATYITLDGSTTYIKMHKHLFMDDSKKVLCGTDGDLELYHDGTNALLKENTGDLTIMNGAADKDIIFQCDDGSGGEETYFFLDGSASSGSPMIRFPDNSNISLGDGPDAFLLHNGNDTVLDNYTGDLIFQNHNNDGDLVFKCDDGSGGIETYFFLDGSLSSGEPYTVFPDDSRLSLGTGADFQMKHNGTDTYLQNFTGHLFLINNANDKDIIFQSDDGSGGVETYFYLDGSFSSGNPVTIFPDNSYLSFGTAGDLAIFHNGSSSNISNVTGNLNILNYANDADISFQCDDGSGGLTEYFRCDGSFGGAGYPTTVFPNNSSLRFGNSGNLQIINNGTDSYIQENNGDLYIRQSTDDKDIIFQCDNGSGGEETYFFLDGSSGGSAPFTVFPDGSTLTFGDGFDLRILHNATDSHIANYGGHLYLTNYADDKDIIFQSDDGSGGTETYFYLDGSLSGGTPYTRFPDSSRLVFGDGADLLIEHDGTNSYISNDTGDLYIRNNANDKDIIFQCDDGSGGTDAYFWIDGSANQTTFVQNLAFYDNVRLKLGTGYDFQIWHSGSHSYIDNAVGDLLIYQNTDDGDIKFLSDDGSGGVTEYFLEVMVQATKQFFQKRYLLNDSVYLKVGGGSDLQLVHDGTHSYISNITGSLFIGNSADDQDISL